MLVLKATAPWGRLHRPPGRRAGSTGIGKDKKRILYYSLIRGSSRPLPPSPDPFSMIKKRRTTPVPRTAAKEEFGVYVFVNGNLQPERLRIMAISLLKSKDLPRMLSGLSPEDQVRFLDRVDQVRCCSPPSTPSLIVPTKVLPTIDSESAKLVVAFGAACRAIRRLPSSAVLSAGLKKRDDGPIAPAGWTETWRGEHGHRRVSMKAFSRYPAQSLEEAKQVRIICA